MFYITALGSNYAILGYPWLKEFNPNIDWNKGQILGPKIQIETCGLGKQRTAVLTWVLNAARASEVWEEWDEVIVIAMSAHVSQQWTIEANRCKQGITMLPD
jgi:hypothetical protein